MRILSLIVLCTCLLAVGLVPMFQHRLTVAHADTGSTLSPGPVSKTWYFAEGRVGKGFEQFFTLDNPSSAVDCAVSLQYLYTLDNDPTPRAKTVSLLVAHSHRLTQRVNDDLGIQIAQVPAATVSTIVTVNTGSTPACQGIVAERPMYFSFENVRSGSDVMGATSLSTTAYFADVRTQAGSVESFFTILNPVGSAMAQVVATYYSDGKQVGTQHTSVPAGARGTLSPNSISLPSHVAAVVTSSTPVLVERPGYASNMAEGNAGVVSSASTVIGAQALSNNILFAEGYTGGRSQEYLVLANLSGSSITGSIKLEYQHGHTQTLATSIAPYAQTTVDVNQLAAHPAGRCDTSPCTISPEVSAQVTTSAGIVAEREMFFDYSHTINNRTLTAIGGTDVIGATAQAYSSYSFAEGYSNIGYNEWLTLQNPSANNETIYATLVNGYGRTYTQAFSVDAHSRATEDITALVLQHLVQVGDDHRGYEVSMTVQTLDGSVFNVERPMYWNTSGSQFPTQGGSDVIGYGASGTRKIAWAAFDGGGVRSGINAAETTINASNVGKLTRLWQQTLPATVDGSPVELPQVATSAGTKDLLFVTTKAGSLLAIDAATGNTLWQRGTQGPNYTTSSPALDPSGQYVYSYGLDGKVHKYAASSGSEITGGGWPATITLMPNVEKGSASLNVGNGYLYMTTSGYPGDGGHYQGHVVAVNLSTGAETVFNSLCANIQQLLDANSGDKNYCPDVQSGIWARGGAVIDPTTGNVFVTTGNGLYNANTGGHDYGDSVIELSPDLTRILDSYTPGNAVTLRQNDQDLGSDAPVLLPVQTSSATPYMAVQGGKDNTLRLLNRRNLSGQGGPNHMGGELQSVALPQGCDVDTQPLAWNDASGTTWVYVATDCGFAAFKVVTNAQGHSSLQLAYSNRTGGSSPFIANGVLYLQSSNVISALNPTTGATLWSSTQASAGGSIGGLHWQSPLVVNGHLYVPDNSGHLTAYGLG